MMHFFGNNHLLDMGLHDIKFSQKRDFNTIGNSRWHPTKVESNKTFTNPNFVNNLNKYQTCITVNPSQSDNDRMKNYENSSLINSIREQCPEIIKNPNSCMKEITGSLDMDPKKDRSHKKKQPRKNSKQNKNRQLLTEMMDFDNLESSCMSFEVEHSPPNKFDLKNIFIDKPIKKVVSTIPIPLINNKDMVVTIISKSPSNNPQQMSTSNNFDNQENISINGIVHKNGQKLNSFENSLNNRHLNGVTPKNGHKLYIFDKQGKPIYENIHVMGNRMSNIEEKETQKRLTGEIEFEKSDKLSKLIQNCQNNSRIRCPSICESEDSFVAFEDNCQNNNQNDYKNGQSPKNRQRYPSICDSEDSFIVFDGGNDKEETESDSDLTDFDDESNTDCENDYSSDEESSFDVVEPKKVHFASPEKLCTVHPMVQWSYAYQAARKGPWEEMVRDRARFKDRIKDTEGKIKGVFAKEHRDQVYRTRFE